MDATGVVHTAPGHGMEDYAVGLKYKLPVKIPVQVGGGVRKKEDIAQLIEGGVSRVVLGTIVLENSAFLIDALSSWKDKIAVSLDCSNGFIAQRGWTENSGVKAREFVKELEILGVTCLIYTDIARDGMLTGPNYAQLQEMCEATHIPIIASGGISNIEDIRKLSQMEKDGIIGCITGKAIYEGKLDLKEALKVC
jgi:phosphoribosylformimino-5-aminoimidazole carboxamide ribotide isomerase